MSVGLPHLSLELVGRVAPADRYVYLWMYNVVHGQVRLSKVSKTDVDSGNTTNGLRKIFDDGGRESYY
jgi:hypothetical protein